MKRLAIKLAAAAALMAFAAGLSYCTIVIFGFMLALYPPWLVLSVMTSILFLMCFIIVSYDYKEDATH